MHGGAEMCAEGIATEEGNTLWGLHRNTPGSGRIEYRDDGDQGKGDGVCGRLKLLLQGFCEIT
jgi:hypothetical protein